MSKIPCLCVDANGRRCTGHVVRIEAFKAEILDWTRRPDGSWKFNAHNPRLDYHIYCSEKGIHTGTGRQDAAALKFYASELPKELLAFMNG